MAIFIVKALVIALLLYISMALVLIATQSTKPFNTFDAGLDFSRESGGTQNQKELLKFVSRDGSKLNYRRYGLDKGPLIIVIHGSSAHGGLYEEMALGLAELGSIVVPDLRGHGVHTPAGDVNYIGQLEDDLTDLIAAVQSTPEQQVILIGHSSGAGLAVRYSGNVAQPRADGVVLLAPYLGHNAPTTRADSGGWAQPLTRRIIGLSMLNAIQISLLNHLPVITFKLPENGTALLMIESYTHRMNESFAPRYDFKSDMARLPTFKIIVGDKDEAFLPYEYEPLLKSFDNKGGVQILNGLSHLDVIGANAVHTKIADFVESITNP